LQFFVFEYLFWVSLFLVFVMAVVRVSVLGLIFVLLYRGEQMIKDSRRRRRLRSGPGAREDRVVGEGFFFNEGEEGGSSRRKGVLAGEEGECG